MKRPLERQLPDIAKHRYVPPEKQIRHKIWTDSAAPREYWETIGYVAHFIGCGLASFAEDLIVRPTIRVFKTQERLGSASVACDFANDELVLRRWEASHSFVPGKMPERFYDDCLWLDVRHFRNTYLQAFAAWPHFYDAIRDGSSYQLLLSRSKDELNELLALGYRFEIDLENEENLNFMYEVCDF